MFFCCGGSKKAAEPKVPADLPAQTERRLSATSTIRQQNAAPPATTVEASQPPPVMESMDYSRARREAEERELERVRSEISGSPHEEPRTHQLRISVGSGGGNDTGFLSPSVTSPRLETSNAMSEQEDDWARAILDSVSRAGSTYGGDKSRPVTPSIHISEPEEIGLPPPSPTRDEPQSPKLPQPQPQQEILHQQEEEEDDDDDSKFEDHTSLYLTHDAAAAFMNYNHEEEEPVPAVPKPAPEFVQLVEEPKAVEELKPEPKGPVLAAVPQDEHTSLYITADAASSFINFDASLAPSQANDTYSNLAPYTTHEVSGNGYPAGGAACTAVATLSSLTTMVDGPDPVFAATGGDIVFRYIVWEDSTSLVLMGYVDMGQTITVLAGTSLNVTVDTNGIVRTVVS